MIEFYIIVPAYNAASTQPTCLLAVQRQSIDRSRYEIIVVDGRSIDHTVASAQKILEDNSFSKIMSIPHGGQAAASNACA